jgi:glycolate oxidase iron-sulfur subunit
MQTTLPAALLETTVGREADQILRDCVHCGFCNATCPTYQLTGDELDGPRGRIYQIKHVLEGGKPSSLTQTHLDRCLTCLACETTCPSGVRYGHLLEIGRARVDDRVRRPWRQEALRRIVRFVLPYPRRIAPLLRAGRVLRPILPARMQKLLPAQHRAPPIRMATRSRNMIILDGCVQSAIAPQINDAAVRVLDALGIGTVTGGSAGCCGAISLHLGATDEARRFMRRNIDAWWPHIEAGAEAIVITASGCATVVRDYGRLLHEEPLYAARAARVTELTRDIGEIVAAEDLSALRTVPEMPDRIAFHSPCTLQHGLRLKGLVEETLVRLGFQLTTVPDPHLCCGSAGTYSLLQPKLARRLREHKLRALESGQPALIATANIGCLNYMAGQAQVPVRHWIELIEPAHREHRVPPGRQATPAES